MNSTIEQLLNNQQSNHMLPFLWIHGESEEVYRRMIKAIDECNIKAFCIEARPHKEFCKDQWWTDLDIILDEAEKRNMKVWILDDKHFPTGYANGGIEKGPDELRREHLCHTNISVKSGKKVKIYLKQYIHPKNNYDVISWIMYLIACNFRPGKKFKDDRLISCTAYSEERICDLTDFIKNDVLCWKVPEGKWTIEICSVSKNSGTHRNYINMLDRESCKVLLKEVYEPHYEHYKDKFGTTIAGFFSDEPELGNGNYVKHYNTLGTAQSLPYSKELENRLFEKLGNQWRQYLPLLWINNSNTELSAKIRYIFMDCVTRLVEEDFSKQIGDWCKDRGVEYIGHIIEDNNQHARTATSLGHYYRGLKYQSMAGIDDIGGQVQPQGEDLKNKTVLGYINDGEFYHYALGKLGASLGAVNPNMNGRTMCEIFGNYGWKEGVHLEKYLLDHFMVRGVNNFVPHAFTCSSYPEKDCPPHFYAHGNDPLFRHFGKLMEYGNRICSLISNGKAEVSVAILYHGEAEWSGEAMMMQKPARILMDHQVDFHFLPSDVFEEREFYKTKIGEKLQVNNQNYRLLIVPYSQFISAEAAQGIVEMTDAGCKVVFIEKLPDGICTGIKMPDKIAQLETVKLDKLLDYVVKADLKNIILQPENNRIRVLHYKAQQEFYYFVNEGEKKYEGKIILPSKGPAFSYDAWENKVQKVDITYQEQGSILDICIEPSKTFILFFGTFEEDIFSPPIRATGKKMELTNFKQSICRSIEYPNFTNTREINNLESYSLINSKFSGYIKYETNFNVVDYTQIILEITDAYEGVEVFVNGISGGIQIVPIYIFDITALSKKGENNLIIEVATTLERENAKGKVTSHTGITGKVNIYVC